MGRSRAQFNLSHEDGILSVIERERSRSQRFHTPTCVVEFDATHVARPDRTVRVLLRGLSKRVRTGDTFGRISDRTIGLLLPATEPAGANKVVRDVLVNLQPGEAPIYTIHGYPEQLATMPRDHYQRVGQV